MTASASVLKSRMIREGILRPLFHLHQQNAEVGMTPPQLYALFSGMVMPPSREEISAEVSVMVEDSWLESDQFQGLSGPERRFRITRQGRDFLLGECPWEAIDKYSGRQKL